MEYPVLLQERDPKIFALLICWEAFPVKIHKYFFCKTADLSEEKYDSTINKIFLFLG